jgi:hypothetical protein
MLEALGQFLFMFSLLLLVYVHFGYPALLWTLGRLRPQPVRRADLRPVIDLVIGAFYEAAVLAKP